MTRRYIEALRKVIEMLAGTLSDEEAMDAPDLFPHWNPSAHYEDGDRVCYEGRLYKVKQGHDAQATWNPVDATALFAEILPGQEGTEIGEWKQPDSTNTYALGARVYHNGKLWESLYPNNSWEPGVFGWQEVE
jgi:chitodextrinase